MEKISDRIQQIITNEKVSTRSFELKIGASNGLIAKSIAKGTDINSIWISKIIDAFPSYNSMWLLTGKGEMKVSNEEIAGLGKAQPVINVSGYCGRCEEKDRFIESQKETIDALKEAVRQLKNNIHHLEEEHLEHGLETGGQKRKTG